MKTNYEISNLSLEQLSMAADTALYRIVSGTPEQSLDAVKLFPKLVGEYSRKQMKEEITGVRK